MKAIGIFAALTASLGTESQPPAIPEQFHGRWAPSARACLEPPAVITIDRRGYQGWEVTTSVVGGGDVRNDVQYFRVITRALPDERIPGTLALRVTRRGIVMSFTRSGIASHWSLVRCG